MEKRTARPRKEFKRDRVTPGAAAGPRREYRKDKATPGAADGPRREYKKGKVTPGHSAGLRKVHKETKGAQKAEAETVRLNKYIANSGVCARREADELIKQGYITVNGKKVTDMGIKVKPSDTVEYKGKIS